MTESTTLAPHIVCSPGTRGGRPYIEGRGVAVEHVAYLHEQLALPAPQIAADYGLSLAEPTSHACTRPDGHTQSFSA